MMSNMKSEAKAMVARPLVVPAGTVLTVRLGQAVGSKISSAGQTFTATLASPLAVDGKTAIPAGATASGTVVDAKPLGRFKGGAVLQLRLTSIAVNGSDQSISTSSVTRTETGKGKRTAVLAGGGAALGALIGGLAGGGKGAGIGALAGGGAGTGGAAFTGNKDIVLPAESALSFKLEQPLEVKYKPVFGRRSLVVSPRRMSWAEFCSERDLCSNFAQFQVLTFDCYGTLIDWETGIFSALRPLLAAHGKTISDFELLNLYSELESEAERGEFRAYREVLKSVVRGFGERLGFQPTESQIRSLPDSLASWPPFPDTVAALRQLKSRYRLAIISNVDDDLFAPTARRLEVDFDAVITAQQAGAYKPSLKIFQLAKQRLGVAPAQWLHHHFDDIAVTVAYLGNRDPRLLR